MSFKNITYQSIALAGVAQSSYLVDRLATQGDADEQAIQASLTSVLVFEFNNPVDIYGGLSGIKIGLEQLRKQLSENDLTHVQEARYAASLIFLERKFANEQAMQRSVRNKLQVAKNQCEHFDILYENVIAHLADIYHNSISTLQPPLMVNGEKAYLSSVTLINKVRALLLAGIRSAMLWRQCGGSRIKFLLFRRKMLKEVEFLLDELAKECA